MTNQEQREKAKAFPFTATLIERSQDPKTPDKWMVSIDGFVTTYTKGTGLREGHKMPYGGGVTIHDMEQFRDPRLSRTVDPTAEEILQSLSSDASCFLGARDIDDFAADFGGEQPISQTLKAWEGCRDAAAFFQRRGLDPAAFAEDAE
jgi:hypothetical protein